MYAVGENRTPAETRSVLAIIITDPVQPSKPFVPTLSKQKAQKCSPHFFFLM
jgi:hypothetical protein